MTRMTHGTVSLNSLQYQPIPCHFKDSLIQGWCCAFWTLCQTLCVCSTFLGLSFCYSSKQTNTHALLLNKTWVHHSYIERCFKLRAPHTVGLFCLDVGAHPEGGKTQQWSITSNIIMFFFKKKTWCWRWCFTVTWPWRRQRSFFSSCRIPTLSGYERGNGSNIY